MSEGDDTVETKLVQVRRLELKHDLDALPADFVCSGLECRVATLNAAELGFNERGAMLNQEIPNALVSDRRDFDKLCKAISDLPFRESLEEREVEESDDGRVVGAEPVGAC
jgi:hypothetical protein